MPATAKDTKQMLPKNNTAPCTVNEQFGQISMRCAAGSTRKWYRRRFFIQDRSLRSNRRYLAQSFLHGPSGLCGELRPLRSAHPVRHDRRRRKPQPMLERGEVLCMAREGGIDVIDDPGSQRESARLNRPRGEDRVIEA